MKTLEEAINMAGFDVLQSFAGTLPADFDYKKELAEMRQEKARVGDQNGNVCKSRE